MACPVDMAGQFIAPVTDFEGLHVKKADRQIIRTPQRPGSLYETERVIQHSYPFCPRSDTPIIYRTIDSWYVAVEEHREKLTRLNEQIHWDPEHIQRGRMGQLAKRRDRLGHLAQPIPGARRYPFGLMTKQGQCTASAPLKSSQN